jgi:hypothetical protein
MKEFNSNAVKTKAATLLQAIRFLRLKTTRKRSLGYSTEFVSNLFTVFKATKQREIRQALADALVAIFKTLIEANLTITDSASMNYSDWHKLLKEFFDVLFKKVKKTKEMQVKIFSFFLVFFFFPFD